MGQTGWCGPPRRSGVDQGAGGGETYAQDGRSDLEICPESTRVHLDLDRFHFFSIGKFGLNFDFAVECLCDYSLKPTSPPRPLHPRDTQECSKRGGI